MRCRRQLLFVLRNSVMICAMMMVPVMIRNFLLCILTIMAPMMA